MSWCLSFIARSTEEVKRYLRSIPVQDVDHAYALPADARDHVLAGLDVAGFDLDAPVKVDASGHRPNSGIRVEITSVNLLKQMG